MDDKFHMLKKIQAIYENGTLRLLDQLNLRDQQRVMITVSDESVDPIGSWLDHDFLTSIKGAQEGMPSFEEVRDALSSIPGNLSDDIRRERDDVT